MTLNQLQTLVAAVAFAVLYGLAWLSEHRVMPTPSIVGDQCATMTALDDLARQTCRANGFEPKES